MKIGLVELPQLKLLDSQGIDWTEQNEHPLISKQILISNLESGGFEVELFNLKNGTDEKRTGKGCCCEKSLMANWWSRLIRVAATPGG
jgi:hypothetical protein